MKLKITLDDRTFEVEVEVAESDHANLPPSYPVGSALLSGAPASAPASAPAAHTNGNGNGNGHHAAGAPVADESKVCRSPVTGIVVKVLAQPGQALQTGDSLVVLEAMKMETHVSSPVAGKVKTVRVAAGDKVGSGDVVVELE